MCEEAKARERAPGEELELIVCPNAYHAFDQKRHDVFLGHMMAYDEQATADSQKNWTNSFFAICPMICLHRQTVGRTRRLRSAFQAAQAALAFRLRSG